MIYKKWDIILVSFPFTDLKSSKMRPALIISPDEYNRNTDLVIAFITSKLDGEYRIGDYKIENWGQAGFPKPSMLRMKFATIDKAIVRKSLGRLQNIDIINFKKEILSFFS